MPVIRQATSVAISTTNSNLVAGNRYEFIERPSIVRVYAVAANDSGAIADGDVLLSVSFTDQLKLDQAALASVAAETVRTGPDRNKDLLLEEAAAPRSRLILSATNTSATASAFVKFLVEIIPIR